MLSLVIFSLDRWILSLTNPFDIITNAEGGNVTLKGNGEAENFADIFQLSRLYYLLKREGLIWCAIVTLALIVTMFFIKRSDRLADRKGDILHKLFIAVLISSALTILSAAVGVFDAMF